MRWQLEFTSKTLNLLILLNGVFFAIPRLISFLSDLDYDDLLYIFGGLVTNLNLLQGEYWRLVTANFLHADELHILLNMLALWNLGRLVHDYYGGKYLFSFYIFSGIGGGMLSLILAPNVFTVGASASIFGLLGVIIANTRKRHTDSLEFPVSLPEILPMAIYSLLFGFIPGTNINNAGHLGGLMAGIILGFVFDHRLKFGRSKNEKLVEMGLFVIALVITALSFAIPLIKYTWIIAQS